MFQQSSKPAGENRRFGPEGLHLVSISVHLLIFDIARGRVLFVGLLFDVMVLRRLLLLLSRRVLSQIVSIFGITRRVPLLVMPLVVGRAGTLGAASHSEVPADRWVDDQCSCVRCGGYEPSII
jgi:hypothetical protein